MTKQGKVALVVGAQGVIGRNLVEHLASSGDWEIIGLSRRGGEASGRVRHIAVDLLDPGDASAKLGALTDVTHIFYAAYQDRPSWAELVPPNLAMLVNVVDAVEPVGKGPAPHQPDAGLQGLRRPSRTLQDAGARRRPRAHAAGIQRRPAGLPGGPAEGQGWTWSAIRPSVVCGLCARQSR